MKIYNLFPTLAGTLDKWPRHIRRAGEMGFDWIFVNPVQHPGRSGSLYSIKDYFTLNPRLVGPRSRRGPEEQLRATIEGAHRQGQRVMVDLVINHCAVDAPIVKEHPDWFVRRRNGQVEHPYCLHDGKKVEWRDLARFDHARTRDPKGLYNFLTRVVSYLTDLGFSGFRCDAAYQLPAALWRRLIADTKGSRPDTVFVAETLGCTPAEARTTASAGFDYVFNSGKWWDFSSPWLMEQYNLLRDIAPSIGFPESHDTPRLFEETQGNEAAMKQRYLFAALFSGGVMLPMGYEFGHRRQLHVVFTGPDHWEEGNIDLRDFVRRTNEARGQSPIFSKDNPTELLDSGNPSVMVMRKHSKGTRDEALIILNKDTLHHQHFHSSDLGSLVRHGSWLVDISPEHRLDFLPRPFSYDLRPGQGFVMLPAGQ